MKKIITFLGVSLTCISAFANISIENRSIAFDKLPTEVRGQLENYYIESCKDISADTKHPIPDPKITFEKEALRDIDFNGDGLKDYIIQSSGITCKGAVSMFTGNSDGFLDIYFQENSGKYNHVINYWLGQSGLILQKKNNSYRYYSKYNQSYFLWDKEKGKFISYYGPEKRIDILDDDDEHASTVQTSTEKEEILKSVFSQ